MRILDTVMAVGNSVVPCVAVAQLAPVKTLPAPGTPMPRNPKMVRAYAIQRGMPYSGLRVVENVTIFPNGERNEERARTKEWRDSEGRTRRDTTWKRRDGEIVTVCQIDDPVALVRYIWRIEPRRKTVVTETHYKMEGSVTEVWPDTPHHKVQAAPGRTIIILKAHRDLNTNSKDQTLGPEYINGVYAEGSRSVEKLPPHSGGNSTDHPIYRIDETWNAPDLNTVVKTYLDTGLGFTERTELKNIDRSEPDPSIFLPPQHLPKREALESDPVWKEPIGEE